jgi:hypothetical protein
MIPKLSSDGLWEFLPHATLKDILGESWTCFWVWLVWSAVSLLIGGLAEFGWEFLFGPHGNESANFLPRWLWITIFFAGLLWFLRGEKYTFVMPKVGWKSWAFLTVVFAVMALVFEYGKWWLALPFFWGIPMVLSCLDSLAAKGRENYQKLQGVQGNAPQSYGREER